VGAFDGDDARGRGVTGVSVVTGPIYPSAERARLLDCDFVVRVTDFCLCFDDDRVGTHDE